MLTSDFTGNLGNHMFQYALTRTVAEHNGYEWGFNPITSNDYYGGRPQMDFMNINYGKQHTAKWLEMPEGIDKLWHEPVQTFFHVDRVNFHPYSPQIFDVEDNTKLVIPCGQDARYYSKRKLREWFQIKEEEKFIYYKTLEENNLDIFNPNTCIINVRGGEYLGIPNVLLNRKYWNDAIEQMLKKNFKMNFTIITDDVKYCSNLFPHIPSFHFSIGMDYFIINNASNLILSNSSFAILPAWLNSNNPFVIAPKWWARHNVSDGYWASSQIGTFGFNFLDREGKLS